MTLADVFVHYDDVQFSKGHFMNRVQVKTASGSKWMTIPLESVRLGTPINEVRIDESSDWRSKHLRMLEDAYADAPYLETVLELVTRLYSQRTPWLCEVVVAALDAVASELGVIEGRRFARSSQLDIGGRKTDRVLAMVAHFGGDEYITGWGAQNYLDHLLFERSGVAVSYMDYARQPYAQLHGEFNASVSILDLIANVGPAAPDYLHPRVTPWRQFIGQDEDTRARPRGTSARGHA
jgi:hypothetical protein